MKPDLLNNKQITCFILKKYIALFLFINILSSVGTAGAAPFPANYGYTWGMTGNQVSAIIKTNKEKQIEINFHGKNASLSFSFNDMGGLRQIFILILDRNDPNATAINQEIHELVTSYGNPLEYTVERNGDKVGFSVRGWRTNTIIVRIHAYDGLVALYYQDPNDHFVSALWDKDFNR